MESASQILRQLTYSFKEALTNIFRNPFMSIVVVSTMTVVLGILGGILLLTSDLHYISRQVESQLQIVVFLNDQTTLDAMAAKIERIEGVVTIHKTSKIDAKKDMLSEIPGAADVLEDTNPFPDTIEVTVAKPTDMDEVVNQIKELPGIEEIQYNQELAEYIQQIEQTVQIVGLIVTAILALATLAIVINTIQLAVHHRHKEIEIMRLVGAPDWLVRMPFLLEGLLFGAVSAATASALLVGWRFFTLLQIKQWLHFLPINPGYGPFIAIVLCILPVGIVMGVLGSVLSVHRYLKFQKAAEQG